MSQTRVLVVPAEDHSPVTLTAIDPTHAQFCALVGDANTDTVFAADGVVMVKVSANGRAMGMQVNPRATQLVEAFLPGFAKRDRVTGAAVFVGLDVHEDPTDVGAPVVELARALFGVTDENA